MRSVPSQLEPKRRGRPRAERDISVTPAWRARPDPRRLARILLGIVAHLDAPMQGGGSDIEREDRHENE